MANSERRQRGIEVAKTLIGDGVEAAITESFKRKDQLMEVTIDHLFGDIWTRPGLSMRDRSLITCATLVALGKEQELSIHLKGLVKQGASRLEVDEMMLHLAHYAGWPCAMTGARVAREIFEKSA